MRRHLEPVPGGPAFVGGAVGYLAYEVASRFEPRVTVPAADPLGLPEAVFLFTDTLLIFDHVRHHARLIAHPDLGAAGGTPIALRRTPRADWAVQPGAAAPRAGAPAAHESGHGRFLRD